MAPPPCPPGTVVLELGRGRGGGQRHAERASRSVHGSGHACRRELGVQGAVRVGDPTPRAPKARHRHVGVTVGETVLCRGRQRGLQARLCP